MLDESFDLEGALLVTQCPRCKTTGMQPSTDDAYMEVSVENRHDTGFVICPATYMRCAACGLELNTFPNLD